MDPSARRWALAQVHLGSLLLAGTALFPRILPLPADQIVLYRSLIAAAILIAIARATGATFRLRSRAEAGWLALCGLLMGLHWVTYYQAIQTAGVALAVVCLYTYPILTVLLEPLLGRTRLQRGDFVAGLLVLGGVALVARPDAGAAWGAAWLSVFSGFCYALRNVLYRHHLRDHSPYSMMGWQFLIVGAVLLPTLNPGVPLDAGGLWWKLLLFGTVFTAAPHLLFVSGLKALTAKSMGLINSLMPLYATVFAWLLLDEAADWNVLAGGALIVSAALYESLKAR